VKKAIFKSRSGNFDYGSSCVVGSGDTAKCVDCIGASVYR